MDKINHWVVMNPKKREDVIIDADLKLIEDLASGLQNSEDKKIIDKISSVIKEIVEIQRDIIRGLEEDRDRLKKLAVNNIPWADDGSCEESEEETINPINSYIPFAKNGFETDTQVRKAFSNYLQYHNVKKLSKLTAYDYCSRVKNLWEPFIKDCKEIKLDIVDNNPMLNVYNNIDAVLRYVDVKFKSLKKGTSEFKNTANASAALNKFDEFRKLVEINR